MSNAPSYWFCLKHHTVEGAEGCPNKDRLGPYDNQAEAARAVEHAAERTAAWDNDPAWNDDADTDADGGPDTGTSGEDA